MRKTDKRTEENIKKLIRSPVQKQKKEEIFLVV